MVNPEFEIQISCTQGKHVDHLTNGVMCNLLTHWFIKFMMV